MVAVLHDRQHWVAGYFVDEIKANRVTLTVPAINHSREIAFLVAGESKAAVVRDVLHGPRDPERLPAQLIQAESGSLTWLLDQAAGMFDTAQAVPLYHQVEQIVVNEASYTFMLWPSEFAARRTNVQGFIYYPDLILRLRDLSLSA